ncbi:MAG: hypothetical protein OHK0024_01480 [Thalassobaculales bacterium]
MARPATRHPAQHRSRKTTLFIVVFFVGAPFLLPTILLTAIAMLPTACAFLVDRRPEKFATFSVGTMNFAGLFPFLMDLWLRGHTIPRAVEKIQDPLVILVIYGAAAVGWLMLSAAPVLIAPVLRLRAQSQARKVEKRRRELVEEWGPEVADPDGQKEEPA